MLILIRLILVQMLRTEALTNDQFESLVQTLNSTTQQILVQNDVAKQREIEVRANVLTLSII